MDGPRSYKITMLQKSVSQNRLLFKVSFDHFEEKAIFRGSWGSNVNQLEPKTKPPSGISAYPNLRYAL